MEEKEEGKEGEEEGENSGNEGDGEEEEKEEEKETTETTAAVAKVTKPGKEQRLRSDFEAAMAAKGMCCGCGAKARIPRLTCTVCDRGYCDDGSCFEQRGEFGCHCAGGIIPMTKYSD